MDDRGLTIRLGETLGAIPGWVWSDAGEPPPSAVGVWYGAIPQSPDRAVGCRVYGGTDTDDVSRRRAQLIFRGAKGDPSSADALADAAFATLHKRSDIPGIAYIERQSFGPLGADGNGREERSDNYNIILENEEAY